MALHINERKGSHVSKIKVDRRLWLDADGRVVEDGDPAAAFLFAAGPGYEVSEADAKEAGYRPKAKKKSEKRNRK